MSFEIGERICIREQTDFKPTLSILEPPPQLQGEFPTELAGKEGVITEIYKHHIYPDFYVYLVSVENIDRDDPRVALPVWWMERA